jgi:ATP-binding cassette subfamily B protein
VLIRLLRTHLRPYRAQVLLLSVLLIAQTVGNLYLPNLNADIINGGVVTGNLHYIIRTGVWMIVLTLVIGLFAVIAVYWASRVSMATGADLRRAVFTRVQSFSARDVNHFGTASLITRNTNDIQQIQIFLQMALTMMVIAPIMSVGGIVMAIHEGAKLSLLLLVSIPVMTTFIGVVMVRVIPLFRSMQVKIDRINQVLREVLADKIERLADVDERLRLLTITSVDTVADLRRATVYLSSLPEAGSDALAEWRTHLQRSLNRPVRMKRTPLLSFEADPAVISGDRVEEALRRIRSAAPPSDPGPTKEATEVAHATGGDEAGDR